MALYNDLAHVYNHMYSRLFDYDFEAQFLDAWFQKYGTQTVVEVGCGSGNLATRLLNKGYNYHGFDISADMVTQAKLKVSNADSFSVGDIRNTSVDRSDAVIMMGRTISYLTTNHDVEAAFSNISKSIKNGGIFIFDPIDADQMPHTDAVIESEVIIEPYKRHSQTVRISDSPYTWQWDAQYYDMEQSNVDPIGDDTAILRAFYHDEIMDFLSTAGFGLVEKIAKQSYIWDDHFYIAQKI